MEIVRRVHSMREIVHKARSRGLKLGFVPTLGCLHEGHLSLVRAVNERSDIVVVSIFVNPTQFGPGEDYERYPRELTRDTELAIGAGVDYLFTPEVNDIYPPGVRAVVDVADLSGRLEGESRPGHFAGVATVVLKLLHVVQPHIVAFGQKDAQQALIVRRVAQDLLVDVEILTLPTIRDPDGLALSSRNAFLSAEQRAAAGAIPRALEAAQHVVAQGQHKSEEVLEAAREVLEAEPLLEIDYVELVDKDSMAPISLVDQEVLMLVAVRCGTTRLIDNTPIKP